MHDHETGFGVGPLRALILALALTVPGAAWAATRTYSVASFERLRVDGAVEVRVETGTAPRASVEADAALLDRITVVQQGETLAVRVGVGEHGAATRASGPAVVTLSTTALHSVAVSTGGRVRVSRVRGQQVNLSVTGTGVIDVAAVEADQLQATVIGPGTMTLAGHAGPARLLTNGPGTIDAGALVANDLTVHLDGPGETRARARYTAQVVNTGLGHVEVTGEAKCSVVAPAGGAVECGGSPQISASSDSRPTSSAGIASTPLAPPPRSPGASAASR